MDARLQRRIQRYGWDRAASDYEAFWSRQLEPAQARALELAGPCRGERALDVACGTGLLTFRVAELVGTTGHVVGTDISGGMLEVARVEAARRGFRQIEFSRMDAESLDLPTASTDVALCAFGLMYVPHPVAALAEMRRVLVPGGRVAVAVWGARARCGWADVFPIVDARVQSDVCPMFFRLGTGDTLAEEMARAGFCDIHVERLGAVLGYDSPEEACGAAFAGGPVALAYSRFDEGTRRAVRAEYLASIAGWRHGSRYDLPGEFVVASARAG